MQLSHENEQALQAVSAPEREDGESRPQNSGTQRTVLLLVGKGLWLVETVVKWVGREVLDDVGQAVVAAGGEDYHLPWDAWAAV